MLELEIKGTERWDEINEEFVQSEKTTIKLEHNLLSISKWESIYNVPFLSDKDKTFEETLKYIECMNVTPNIDREVYLRLTPANIEDINSYIRKPMTAVTFPNEKEKKGGGGNLTSEMIYYFMIAFNIPVEFEKWHLNRLLTLIKICDIKNRPPKKLSPKEIMERNKQVNEENRRRWSGEK